MRSVSWQGAAFCVAGAIFGGCQHSLSSETWSCLIWFCFWQAQLSSCAMLPNLTRRKTKEGRMPGLRAEAKAPFRWAAGNGHLVCFSATFHLLGRVCVANGVFVSSKNRSLNKQRPHSPSANCVQLRDAVALNSVLGVAQIALSSKGAIP